MEELPKDWMSVETLNRFGAGIIMGAVMGIFIAFRIVKSGVLVFGDKAKLLVQVGVLEEKLAQRTKEVAKLTESLKSKLDAKDSEITVLKAEIALLKGAA